MSHIHRPNREPMVYRYNTDLNRVEYWLWTGGWIESKGFTKANYVKHSTDVTYESTWCEPYAEDLE